MCVCVRVCVSSSYALGLGCKFKPSTSDGDLEFSGVQIHWPLLVYQLRVQVGLCPHP